MSDQEEKKLILVHLKVIQHWLEFQIKNNNDEIKRLESELQSEDSKLIGKNTDK